MKSNDPYKPHLDRIQRYTRLARYVPIALLVGAVVFLVLGVYALTNLKEGFGWVIACFLADHVLVTTAFKLGPWLKDQRDLARNGLDELMREYAKRSP